MTERSWPIEIDVGSLLYAVTFSANGDYLFSGGLGGIRVWRVKDGKEMARMEGEFVNCLAVSKDGRWVAAGSFLGDVIVWDTETYEKVLSHRMDGNGSNVVNGVDFSTDSTRLIVASWNCKASVWDIPTRTCVETLEHPRWVLAAKYSPQGDRFATATPDCVRVYDSKDSNASLLLEIPVKVTPWYNANLLWSNEHLIVISDGKIKQIEAPTGSTVSEWPVPDSTYTSRIVLPQHGEFIACSTEHTITFWDTSAQAQLGLVRHAQHIRSTALSPDDRLFAIGGEEGKITIERLSRIPNSIPLSRLLPTFQAPEIRIDIVPLSLWKRGQLADAEAKLTTAIPSFRYPSHHVLASRALIRARLQQWDAAISGAEESIQIYPSLLGYVAKGIALVGKGEKLEGYRACDVAFERVHSTQVTFLLLIKAIIVFIAGEHRDAISRVDDLIATVNLNSICYVVQAYMHVHLGNTLMESGDYNGAIQSFERARTQMRSHTSQELEVVSLIFGWKFDNLEVTIGQRLCEALYVAGRTKEAGESLLNVLNVVDEVLYVRGPSSTWVSDFLRRYRYFSSSECVQQMRSQHGEEINPYAEQAEWVLELKQHLSKKIECFGDAAINAQEYDVAILQYSAALSLDPASPQGLLIKRSKAYLARGLLEYALHDADQIITLDLSSPWGYERKHAALHSKRRYDDAISMYEIMLSKMKESPDPEIHARFQEYVNPVKTKEAIRKAVQDAIRDSPPVLINTTSGRLLDKHKQASSFESSPVFKEMISSMTEIIDHARIQQEVEQYYRYATFSHTWEANEPLFHEVAQVVVYDLRGSSTHDKLKMFCKIVRDAGFHWAWSDTCCINKVDHRVLQEALVLMFKWYEGSALTIVLLREVRSPSKRGDLRRSIWNTRAWTLQEYYASKVVRFYTGDWKPYMNLDIPNHKDSPEIISEMQEANGISAMTLRPGLEHIREKLRVASQRQVTFMEDAAYSLLGIFSLRLSIVYGEGDQSLGRLLAQLLMNSGDTSILAWTGRSGSFNSCLPVSITAFSQSTSDFIPTITCGEMEMSVSKMRNPPFTSATKLYEQLRRLPVPSFSGHRMTLHCLTFKLGLVQSAPDHSFHAKATGLGVVKIKTREELSRLDSLILIHPWIDFLLDKQPLKGNTETPSENTNDSSSPASDASPPGLFDRIAQRFNANPREPGLPSPVPASPADRRRQVLQFMTRLRQPFGALLLTPIRQNADEYRRVASESLITVQVEEPSSKVLKKLIEGIRAVDVL